MERSGFVASEELKRDLATGWMWTYDGRRFPAPTFALGTAPAGNLYADVLDLAKFVQFLFETEPRESSPVQPDTLRQMMTLPEGKEEGFGIGFHVRKLDGEKLVGHGGAVYGFATELMALPDRKVGVVVATSLDCANGVAARLGEYAIRLVLATQKGEELPSYRTTTAVPQARARELVGAYQGEEGIVEATELAGKLYVKRGPYRREVRATPGDLSLVVDDVFGFGDEVRLEERGELFVGAAKYVRLPDAPPAEAPERWRPLIGEYGWDHNTLYILEDRGRLVALIEWFFYYPLEELGENEFAFPDTGLYHGEKLNFRRENGKVVGVTAASVDFPRRETARDGETFKIRPLKPIEELRKSAMAAAPPIEKNLLPPDLAELTSLDPSIALDVRYATKNNFMGSVFYESPRAFLQRPAAEAVVRVQKRLKERGLGLLIHDAYRPWFVTKMFFDATPDALKDFVADPSKGSRHNRGCAVDLTLCDLATGEPLQMVAGYDEFSSRAYPEYPGGTSLQRWRRSLLRRSMEAEGFSVFEFEWWHFDYQDWKRYPILNEPFERLGD
jgi:D-alanyl-D-alanine dipeptidase